jgi:TonB family protein
MLLPWVKIEALKTTVPEQYAVYPEFLWNTNSPAVLATGTASSGYQISWQEGVLYGGMFLAALYFGYKLYRLRQLREQGTIEHFPNFTQVVVKNSELAFSFFKSIFLGDKVLSREHKSIIQHELVHIKQKHSLDLVFFELMRIIGWFNPLVYVYQNRISELHEFIADAHVPKTERAAHYDLLLSQVFQTQNISFVNHFFKKSLIKKRIVMLQKSKSKSVFQLKYLMLVPLVFGMLVYSSCELESDNEDSLKEIFIVEDIENIGSEKTDVLFTRLIDLSVQPKDWSMVLQDSHSTVTFTKAHEGSGISGPNDIIINAKMHIESKILDEDFELFKVDSTKALQFGFQNGAVPFSIVEEVPIFPGCETALDKRICFNEKIQKHISKNFNYPQAAQEADIQGRVNVMFIIQKDGSIGNMKLRGPDKLLEDEVERIINRLPTMTPGKQKGTVVAVPFSIPVTFKLQ